ncbi:DUF2939 domain-containing protein [Phenylobacterium sp.]|uniref:DUF2939 domain-containing protein n=1 Tax=Phenylobacterium sp. TaxID=1871053 RepID=UPI003BAAF19F
MRGFVIVLMALALSACATVQKLDAASDVHALLISIRDGDRATFNTLVDERSLKQEIQSRLVAEARRDARVPSVLAAVLAPSLAEIAGEALIRPEVFRAVAEEYGYRRDMAIPGPIGISTMLKPLDDGRVCAVTKSGGPCQLIFAQAPDGRWRLSGFAGDLSRLRINR